MAATERAFDYLESLPGLTLRQLYSKPSTTLAIFRRMLPHLTKTIIMAALYLPRPLALNELDLWVDSGSKAEKEIALGQLDRLKIRDQNPAGQSPSLVITNSFQTSLRSALTGEKGKTGSFGTQQPETQSRGQVDGFYSSRPDEPVDSHSLDQHARQQWDRILQYMVGSVAASLMGSGRELTPSVQSLLIWGNLVQMKGKIPQITKLGFEFLLQGINAQVWTLLIQYFENAEQKLELDEVEVLNLVFMLSGLNLGSKYATSTLSEDQRKMLPDLGDLGLIWMPSRDSRFYYPTRLATTLTSESSSLQGIQSQISSSVSPATTRSGSSTGFIIIETNYRVYAYTSSPLQIAILALFSDLTSRYPNMVTAKIRRSTIRRAVEYGITADQIISFLSTHAHPQMRSQSSQNPRNPSENSSKSILPPTVIDQIRLWQMEYERVKATSGYLIKGFSDQAEYKTSVNYADDIGVLVWRNDKGRRFFITRVDQLAAFMKERGSSHRPRVSG